MNTIKQTKRIFLDAIPLSITTVLDIGCSRGYMSKRFAKKGAEVTGVDKRPQELSQEHVTFVQEDIRDFEFSTYDLVIASLVLHFFSPETAKTIIKKMQDSTHERGFNLLIVLSEKDALSVENKFYPSFETVKEFYSGWNLVKFLEDETEKEVHSKGEEHSHHLIFCLFQK